MARDGEKSAWKDNYVAIKDVTATEDKTVTISLKQPYAPLLSVLAMFSGGILPADMAKATDAKDYDNANAWKTKGTGAYYVEGWKKGDPIVLKRNPNYWNGTPAVDEVRIEYIPDDNTRVLKLQGAETDLVDFVPFSQISALSAQSGVKAQTFTIQQTAFVILNTANILKEAWAKLRVTVDIQTLDTAVVRTNYRAGDFMSTPSAWTNDMNDPTEIVNYAMRGGASPFAYWTRYNNPDLNDKITKADLEQDPKKREADYSEIQKI